MIPKLEVLFSVLQKWNLTLSPSKCQFHQTAIDYPGFHLENHTIQPISSNIIKITAFPAPKTKKHLKIDLSASIGFYSRFIPNYSKLMNPLIKLTSPKIPFQWSEDHDEIFKQVQKVFFSKLFLSLPDCRNHFFSVQMRVVLPLLVSSYSKSTVICCLLVTSANLFLLLKNDSQLLNSKSWQ